MNEEMIKKSHTSRVPLISYYKWRFLRLNDDYVKDYQACEAFIKKSKTQLDAFISRDGQRLFSSFFKKWGIATLLSPKRIPPIGSKIYKTLFDGQAVQPLTNEVEKFLDKSSPVHNIQVWAKTEKELASARYIDLRIDIQATDNSISKGVIQEVKKWRRLSGAHRGSKSKGKRSRPGDFDEYLQLYEFKLKQGPIKNRDLAKKWLVHKGRPVDETAVRLTEDLVRKQLAVCGELIEGAYRKIKM